MAKKLLDGAIGAVSAFGGMARHLAWYLSHQLGGEARDREPED
jgi:hypothetical protein